MDVWGWAAAGGGIAIVFLLGLAALSRGRARPDRTGSASGDSNPELVLGDMTEILSEGLPGETRDRSELLPELARAGMYRREAITEYRAVRTVLVLTPLFLAAAVALLVQPHQIIYVAIGGVILAGLGFSLPRVYVSIRATERIREIERGLPLFADMLSIALLAGQGMTGALRRVTLQLRGSFPRMAEELEIVSRQAEMLNLHSAFEQWANRSQSTEVRNLSLLLGQCQRLGNDITAALLEYATHLRVSARQRADAKAQRASFWMMFPTILCLWIPAAIIMVGPVYFEFKERRIKIREQIDRNKENSPIGKTLDKGTPGLGEGGKSP